MAYDEGLAQRLREQLEDRAGMRYDDALAQPHCREMDFTGKPMRGLVYVGTAGIAEDDDLAGWVGRGVAFASSLPAK